MLALPLNNQKMFNYWQFLSEKLENEEIKPKIITEKAYEELKYEVFKEQNEPNRITKITKNRGAVRMTESICALKAAI